MLSLIKQKIGRWIAQYLSTPIPRYHIFSTYDIPVLEQVLQPGDILLVEGDTRISIAIKYLTQSTWSHSAFYAGEQTGIFNKEGESCVLIEAEIAEGVVASPLSKYQNFNIRICRPVNLTDEDRETIVQTMIDSVGKQYDLKHIFDLTRYLLPTPPIPARFRRRMLAFGSGDPSRAICSSLIAETFQSVNYPILPRIEKKTMISSYHYTVEEIYHIRHHSLFTPRDFDLSPFFEVVKPTIAKGFNYQTLTVNHPASPHEQAQAS